jgi:hypothetical protein
MLSRNSFLILSIVSAALALFIAGTTFTVTLTYSALGAPIQVPAGVFAVLAYLCGLGTLGGIAASKKRREIVSEQHLQKWEKQDQKLMAEVASDKEKQLESKIDTLEVALKSALKKKGELEDKVRMLEEKVAKA